MQEPIPDYNDAVSHLRVVRHQYLRNVNPISLICNDLTTFKSIDFSRCLFKIVGNMVIYIHLSLSSLTIPPATSLIILQ